MSIRKVSLLGLVSLFLAGLALGSEAIPNWPAPATWPPSSAVGVHTMDDVTVPLPFIGVTPCRVVDTRGNGFVGQYGPPAIAANTQRTFTIAGQCGIPAEARAVSFNIGALDVGGTGDLRVFPAGGVVPLVSTLNYNANTPNIANAAVVSLSGGAITVQADAVSIDLIIDVNGYYSAVPAAPTTFVISTSASTAIVGEMQSTSNGTSAIVGRANGLSGATVGVRGETFSLDDDAAGVFGVPRYFPTLPSPAYAHAGVRGESSGGYGVLGINDSYAGVAGVLVDSGGTQVAYALLAVGGTPNYAVYGAGNFGGTGAKYFVEPHPTDASKVIRYVSLEGPESGTYFRGRGKFENGLATIEAPEDFRMVTDSEGLSIQVTPIGELASVAVLRIELDGIVVKASRNVEFFYTVNGVRRTHKDLRPIGPGEEFVPRSAEARMPAYLTEGQKAMLISNGTYNADGTVNMETAERLGWAKAWRERGETAAGANPRTRAARPAEGRP